MTDKNTDSSDDSGKVMTDGGDDSVEQPEQVEKAQMSIYIHKDTEYNLKRWLDEMKLDNREVFDSDRLDQYEAIIRVAMEHEDEVVDKIKEISTS